MNRFALFVLVVACGLIACGPGPVDICTDPAPGPMRTAVIGTYVDGGDFVPYVNGGETPLVFGFQGGYMVTPAIRIPAEASDGPTPCFTIRVDNELDPPGSAPDLEFSTFTSVDSGMYEINITNFLGNVRRDLIGRTLTMDIRVVADGFAIEDTIQVVLTPET